MPGTITPDPDPVEVETAAALPSASITETCVVPPGAAFSALAVQVALDPPACRPQRFRCEEPTREPAAMEISREPGAPRATLLAHHLGERSDRLGAARGRVRETLEQREPVGDQNAAGRRRRVREHVWRRKTTLSGRRQTTR